MTLYKAFFKQSNVLNIVLVKKKHSQNAESILIKAA